MKVQIERIHDLFDEDIVEEMLGLAVDEDGCCHYNTAMVCVTFDDWKCIDYVEGYAVDGTIGHAINSYRDAQGNYHYFDITQESNIKNNVTDKFYACFDVVKTFTTEEICKIFEEDGFSHLVTVNVIK